MGALDGKVVLVTGAGSGIGRATALRFAEEGARAVVCADIDAASAARTAAEVRALGAGALDVVCDVSDAHQVDAMVRACVDTFGRLDCAHNNAGVSSPPARTADTDDAHWHRVLDVVLTGTYLCMKAELAVMAAQGSGAIVNTASTASFTAVPGVTPYVAAKHGVLGLTRNAALEYVRDGVRVNAICPGATHTELLVGTLGHDPSALARVAGAQPGGRVSEPREQAEAVVWLCSPLASFVNGVALAVDNGATVGATVDLAPRPPSA
jgi:NAD(P)-dependent dehydrogenase (short-subunit alcohol dehydrogenase family)